MAQLADIVFDCRHPAQLARFWVGVLDDYQIAPYDDAERVRLGAMGIDDPEHDPTVLLVPPPWLPRLWFQYVPEPKRSKNRVHLDLRSADPEAEIERLTALGAAVVRREENEGWVGLADPEGNEFCLFRR